MSGLLKFESFGMDGVKRAETLLVNVNNGVYKAMKATMPRVSSHLRVETTKAVKERYAITTANIRAEENVKASISYGAETLATILYSGYRLPLIRFQGSGPQTVKVKNKLVLQMVHGQLRPVHPGVAAKGRQLKGSSPTTFKNAFTQRMPNSGHIGIFERTGGKTKDGGDAIHQLMGLSIPEMIGNGETRERVTAETNRYFSERMDHEVTRLLNGWGTKT